MTNVSFNISTYMGKARSGKTLSMVASGYNTLLEILTYIEDNKNSKNKFIKDRVNMFKKFRVWSNLNLNRNIFGDYRHIDFNTLIEMYEKKEPIEYVILLIDDIFKNVDSRNIMNKKNKVFSYFITEIGKKKNILKYVSHFQSMVEIRLRNFTETFIYCQKGKLKDFKINGKTYKNLIWQEEEDYYKLDEKLSELKKIVIKQNYLKEYIDMKQDLQVYKKVYDTRFLEAYPFFKMYNTGEIV